MLQNIFAYVPIYKASCPRRLESLTIYLSGLEMEDLYFGTRAVCCVSSMSVFISDPTFTYRHINYMH
jgi:hypothetical protein